MRRLVVLSCLVLIGFALRVHLLGDQELRGDEGFTWNYIQKPPLEILATIIREGDPQPPLHYWLGWGWALLTGDTEFAMRAWSAMLSLLLVPLMYHAGRKFWRAEVGLLAASVTAVHPQQIWLAQDVRNMYQLALIFLLVATLCLPRFKASKNWGRSWLVYVACGALAMYSHYYSLFFLLAHGAYFIASFPSKQNQLGKRSGGAVRWASAGLAIAALVAPWAAVILPVYSRGQLADPGALPLLQYTLAVFGDLAAGPAFLDSVKTILALAFALLSAISIVALVSRPPSQRHNLPIYLLAGLLIPYLGIYAITLTRATFNTFYFVFAFPAAYLLIAGAIFTLYQWRRPLGVATGLVGLIAFGYGLSNHYFNPDYSKTRGMRALAARLAEAAEPSDIYLANVPDPAQVYYLRRLHLPFHLQPGQINFKPEQVDAELAKLSAARLWFVPVQSILDPDLYVQGRLLDGAILAEDDRFHKMRLMLFLPPSAAHPVEAQFADGIRLAGYYLTPNRLTLVWRADQRPSADYTVFVHALAADTFNLAGHDAPPNIPASQWQPGGWIVDVHEFNIPMDQPITLVAGMYLPETSERLALKSDSFGEPNAARVTTLEP